MFKLENFNPIYFIKKYNCTRNIKLKDSTGDTIIRNPIIKYYGSGYETNRKEFSFSLELFFMVKTLLFPHGYAIIREKERVCINTYFLI